LKTSLILLIVALCGATGLFTPTVCGEETPHTLVGNLEYRWSFGDLPYAKFMPGRGRSVLVIEGGDALREKCKNDPDEWTQDNFFERIGHADAAETFSCRERDARPSLHLRYIKSKNETWIHFDLDGSGNKWRHFGELVRNRATFSRTHQDDVYRMLVEEDPTSSSSLIQSLKPSFDPHEQFAAYVHKAFSREAFAQTISESAFVFAFHTIEARDNHQLSFEQYLGYHAADGGLQYTIGAATAIALRQDVRFKSCTSCSTFRQRLMHALWGTVLVDGYDGHHEFAFSRLASAFGAAYIEEDWLSSTRRPADPMHHVGNTFLSYAAESAYVDFVQPMFKNLTRKVLAKIR
jgi:hypothetical protein